VFAALLVLWAGGDWAYLHREGFLNKGYNLPLGEMAAIINQGSAPGDLILLDGCNSDASAFLGFLEHRERVAFVLNPASARRAADRSRTSRTVWYWRNTHYFHCTLLAEPDIFKKELQSGFETRRYLFVPYSPLERRVIQRLRWPEQPDHLYQILELRRKAG
jgi:hypothetical protein